MFMGHDETMRLERPLIGISTRPEDENGRYALSEKYVTSVRRAGGIPILLPPGEPDTGMLLKRIDGLILSGGGDIDPALYGGLPHETIYNINIERDQSEIRAVQYALSSHLPLLGICRGIQVINIALNGTLIEHVPDVVGDEVKHRLPGRGVSEHSVKLLEDSLVAKIFGQNELSVPSCHHQAIRQLALPLRNVAYSQDGIIEAVELADHPSQGTGSFFIGVQWHPELSADPLQQRLFDQLIEAAARRGSNPT